MLIDDNEDDNYFHRIILDEMQAAGNVQVLEGGIEALEYFRDNRQAPDLIFLDINMPKMNGWEFLDEYRKRGINSQTNAVIIMLTTSLNPSDKEKSLKIPEIKGFETKPLTQEMMERILDTYWG